MPSASRTINKKQLTRNNVCGGFTLVEILLSLFFIIAIVTILFSTSGTLLTRRRSDQQSIAAKIATKEMERLRSVPFLNFQNGTEETYACSTTHPVSGEQAELNKLRAGQFCRNVSAYGSPPDPDIQWVTVTIKWNNDNNVQQLPLTMDTLIYESGL